jgi:lysophospholipase L1-like esterase
VVLLLEGVNDLNQLGADGMSVVINGLRNMVRQIRTYGVPVFLATIPPQRPGAMRALSPTLVAPTDDQIRTLAANEGAVLVDIYRDFNGDVVGLIGDDGLHPNAAGYQRMAESFVAAIRANLELAPAPTIVSTSGLPGVLTRAAPAVSSRAGYAHR